MPKSRTTAIVLMAPGDEIDPGLRCEIEGRGWRLEIRHDPLSAMAEVCLREKARLARGEWGLPDAEAVALIVADDGAESRVSRSVASYLPAVDRWCFSGGTLRRDPTMPAGSPPASPPPLPDDPAPPPPPRRHADTADADHNAGDDADDNADRLSRAEIDMLLTEMREGP